MSWNWEANVTGRQPGQLLAESATEVGVVSGEGGQIELVVGHVGQQLWRGWADAPGRVRLDAREARRLAYLLLLHSG